MELQPGQTILNGKYRIERLLGRGAFGEVYLATHIELNVPRAVKVLRRDAPGVGSTEFGNYRARFQLEAELGAHLDDPHVVRVYDFEEEEGVLYLVMAYCAGGSLKDRLDHYREARQPMPVAEAVRIVTDAARGLAAIHARELVHRDLKPSNILLDADGRALVGDLGLAQRPGGPTRGSLISVAPSDRVGTPEYMSPEQGEGKGRLRPPSDIYALGAVLFEMLTGKLYYNQRPGTRARSLRPDIPKWLDDLIARMLAARPEDRPWDGAEAARLLERRGSSVPWRWIMAGIIGVAALAVVAWLWLRPAVSPAAPVASPTATPTSAPAPNLVPTVTWTARPEPTKTPEPTATRKNTSTPTLAPTDTRVPTITAIFTTAVTATSVPKVSATKPAQLPAPPLESPADGAAFSGTAVDVVLAWRGVKPTLAADEYYLVTLHYKHEGQIWTDYVWTKETLWDARKHVYLLDLTSDGRFTWTVRLVRAASVPQDGKPTGAEIVLSETSQPRVFVWKRETAITPGITTGPTPTPVPATPDYP